jgi:aspartyl-tRNA(Asn)/glutamyl-tRNA(Gln) amidotransferase subunit C
MDSTTDRPLSAEDVQAIAHLARLGLPEAETRAAAAQLAGVLAHFRALQAVDTRGVEPLTHAVQPSASPAADAIQPFAQPRERLLAATEHAREGFLVVPRILEADFGPVEPGPRDGAQGDEGQAEPAE